MPEKRANKSAASAERRATNGCTAASPPLDCRGSSGAESGAATVPKGGGGVDKPRCPAHGGHSQTKTPAAGAFCCGGGDEDSINSCGPNRYENSGSERGGGEDDSEGSTPEKDPFRFLASSQQGAGAVQNGLPPSSAPSNNGSYSFRSLLTAALQENLSLVDGIFGDLDDENFSAIMLREYQRLQASLAESPTAATAADLASSDANGSSYPSHRHQKDRATAGGEKSDDENTTTLRHSSSDGSATLTPPPPPPLTTTTAASGESSQPRSVLAAAKGAEGKNASTPPPPSCGRVVGPGSPPPRALLEGGGGDVLSGASAASFEFTADCGEWFLNLLEGMDAPESFLGSHLASFATGKGAKERRPKDEAEARGPLTTKNDRHRHDLLAALRERNDATTALLRHSIEKGEDSRSDLAAKRLASMLFQVHKMDRLRSRGGGKDAVATPGPVPGTNLYAIADGVSGVSSGSGALGMRGLPLDALLSHRVAGGGEAYAKASGRDLEGRTPSELCADPEDYKLRTMRLSVLKPSTLQEIDQHTATFADAFPDEARCVDGSVYTKMAYRLGEAALGATFMLYRYENTRRGGIGRMVDLSPSTTTPGFLKRDPKDPQLRLGYLLNMLLTEFRQMSRERAQQLTRYMDVQVRDVEMDLYTSLCVVGAILFFAVLPLPLLQKVCDELGVSTSNEASMDRNLLPEVLAEKIAIHAYPLRDPASRISLSHVVYVPRLQVHEHAPGSYTCTVDNACFLDRLPLTRLLSNRFSCAKLKWRGELWQRSGKLSLHVWHRHTAPVQVRIILRSSERRKKRKGGDNALPSTGEGRALSLETECADDAASATHSALQLEKCAVVQPGDLFGFRDFLSLHDALSALTTQGGIRTYNKAEDRLMFQLALELDGALKGGGATSTATATAAARTPTPPLSAAAPPAAASVSCRTASSATDKKEKREGHTEARLTRLLCSEEAGRKEIEEAHTQGLRQLRNTECREAQRAEQRAADRERKLLLSRAGPSPELLREVERFTQVVQSMRQQVAKMQREKLKEEREAERIRERIAQGRSAMTELEEAVESNQRLLCELEEQIRTAQARIADKKKRLAQREQKRSTHLASPDRWIDFRRVFEPAQATTHHDTLAINDFESFLTYNQPPDGAALPLQQQQPQQQQPAAPSSDLHNVDSLMNLFTASTATATLSPTTATAAAATFRTPSPLLSVPPALSAFFTATTHAASVTQTPLNQARGGGAHASVFPDAPQTSPSSSPAQPTMTVAGPDPYLFTTRQAGAGLGGPSRFNGTAGVSSPPTTSTPLFTTQPKALQLPRRGGMAAGTGFHTVSDDSLPLLTRASSMPHVSSARSSSTPTPPSSRPPPPPPPLLPPPQKPSISTTAASSLEGSVAVTPSFQTSAAGTSVFSQLDANAQPFNPSSAGLHMMSLPPAAHARTFSNGAAVGGASSTTTPFAFKVTASPSSLSIGAFAGPAGASTAPLPLGSIAVPTGSATAALPGPSPLQETNLSFPSTHMWS